jgi:hypothetical protein
LVAVFEPAEFVAVRVTVYAPATLYVWLGFRWIEVVPSPKFQDQLVGAPVELSVKLTVRGACPETGEPEKPAVGRWVAGVVPSVVNVRSAHVPTFPVGSADLTL